MSRGFVAAENGASQVVALNLTNLFVLVLLKALIFAAGSLGAGAWKGGFARSGDGEEKLLTDEEILLFASYLTGKMFGFCSIYITNCCVLGTPGNNNCLRQVACQDPQQAQKYVMAGGALLKVSKMLSLQSSDDNYETALKELEEAANSGLSGDDCQRYKCGQNKDTIKNRA